MTRVERLARLLGLAVGVVRAAAGSDPIGPSRAPSVQQPAPQQPAPQQAENGGCRIKTLAEVRMDLDRRGLTIRQWSRQNGISDRIVRELLRGRFQGKYGQAHRAAVLLGLKDGVVE